MEAKKLNSEIGVYYDSTIKQYISQTVAKEKTIKQLEESRSKVEQQLQQTLRDLKQRKATSATSISIRTVHDTFYVDTSTNINTNIFGDSTYLSFYNDSSLDLTMYAGCKVDSISRVIKIDGIKLYSIRKKAKKVTGGKGKVDVITAVLPLGFEQAEIVTIKNVKTHKWWQFWKK